MRCSDLATLKRTLATASAAIRSTVGSICLVVISCPHTSDSTWGGGGVRGDGVGTTGTRRGRGGRPRAHGDVGGPRAEAHIDAEERGHAVQVVGVGGHRQHLGHDGALRPFLPKALHQFAQVAGGRFPDGVHCGHSKEQ